MIRRYISSASIACTMVLGMSGAAFASDTVTISETGADSVQTVKIDNSSTIETTNTNNVHVVNVNAQKAESGDVDASKNTSIGGSVGSGSASNVNTTDTSVTIGNNNGCDCVTPGGGGGGNNGGGSTVTPGSGGGSAVTPGMGQGGSVLGASTVSFGSGAGVLPEVGAKFPVDVSALRAAWDNKAPAANLAKGSSLFTNFMLLTAALLSLIGAAGSFWYAKRREERI